MDPTSQAILKNLETFVAFARKRIGDPHLAEDLVQESLLKALTAARQPTGERDTLAWFYRILRRSLIDLYRKQTVRKRALHQLERELPTSPTPAETRILCACFRRLLPAIPEGYRDLLERIDLRGQSLGQVAETLGLTRNNLTVRLHRARRHLREALAKNCRACSRHGCLDCTCADTHAAPANHPRRTASS